MLWEWFSSGMTYHVQVQIHSAESMQHQRANGITWKSSTYHCQHKSHWLHM